MIDAFATIRALEFLIMKPGERVLSRVEQGAGCWLYDGTPSQQYGQVWDNTRHNNTPAHVAAYEYLIGPVPEGCVLHHECRTKRCVRPGPGHVVALRKSDHSHLHHPPATECIKGHPFAPGNTRIAVNGQQVCRICATQASRDSRERHRGKLDTRTKVCEVCGAEYHPPRQRWARSKVCSRGCRNEAIRRAKIGANRQGGRFSGAANA